MTSTDSNAPAALDWVPRAAGSWPSRPGPVSAAAAAIAIVGGFLTGVVTQVLQGELPGSWNVLANSGAAWSLAAAAIGMLMPNARSAVAGGATSLVVASFSYYWAVDWFEGTASNARSSLIWAAVGVIAGAVFGLAGWIIRCDSVRRWMALAVVGGLLLGEGCHLLRVAERLRPAGVVLVALGGALAITCVLRGRRPLLVTGLVAGGAICYAVALRLVDAAFTLPW